MAATTIPPRTRDTTSPPWSKRARAALAKWAAQGATAASAARHRLRRPALVTGGLACFTTSAWHTYGIGAGLLVLGLSMWAFEWLTGDDEPGSTQ